MFKITNILSLCLFDHAPKGTEVSKHMLGIRQGRCCAADYALKVCTLTAESGWNKKAHKTVFCQGTQ